MSSTAAPPSLAGESTAHKLRPGSLGFIATLGLGTAVTALGIDAVLPAFPEIREAMGLDADSNEVAGLVSFYLLGSSLGLLPAGLLADRFGRRPVIFGGLALYVLGAVASLFAGALGAMFAIRFVWGLGSAGPRVAAMAMVRDSYAGEQMAKQMSFITAIFILVPVVAPTLGSGILAVAPWEGIFWFCAAFGVFIAIISTRLPETLHTEDRATLRPGSIVSNIRTVLTAPGSAGYLLALTALFGAFFSYLGSSESILDQVFDYGDWFPLFFGGVAAVLGISVVVNGRIVERVGLGKLLTRVYASSIPATATMFGIALATDGVPNFWAFLAVLCIVLFCHQMLIPNLMASGMEPLAHVAGTASAIFGMVPGAVGSLIAVIIDRQFDGTILPFSTAFFVCTAISAASWRWGVSASRRTAG